MTNSSTANNHMVYSLLDGSNDGSGGDDGGGNDGDETGDTAPAIDTFDASSRTTGPWFRATVNWTVSDVDGDLDTVVIEMLDGNSVVDSSTINVSGSSASGESELRTRDSADSFRLTVTDQNGNSTTEIKNI